MFEVESYNETDGRWSLCPPLNDRKGNLGGATLDGKIFAIGGGNAEVVFSDVEMLDPDIGRWIRTRSMEHKVNLLHYPYSLYFADLYHSSNESLLCDLRDLQLQPRSITVRYMLSVVLMGRSTSSKNIKASLLFFPLILALIM